MAIYKCKMCGGTLEINEGERVCTCEYCGSQQTIPATENEALQGLFNRANILRMKSEFDKAAELYEKIIQANETEAEAYWGLILCKYGIEYVEDPATYKRVPTCHRASYDAVTADEDYKNAVRYADLSQKILYEREAAKIEDIQKGIIALAQKEEPYDVFICYKETDELGSRTVDSVMANDIYHQLTTVGYKVFYAAITLEDKLGQEYEPYIFSALNSAKVMIVLGTKPEYFNAVWVKNEWSRFLKLMKKDRSKLLIPCYRDMDAYELPEEFAHLQAQDMAKIGFINDIVRGIKKVVVKESFKKNTRDVVMATPPMNANITALIKRGNMALEDKEWDKADGFFDEVLNYNAECAEAYLGKALAERKVSTISAYFDTALNFVATGTAKRTAACSPDKSHIDKMVEENEVAGYLEADEIVNLYDYDDFYYDAEVHDAEKEKFNAVTMFIDNNKSLVRAIQFAGDPLKKVIDSCQKEFLSNIDAKINKSVENNNNKADDLRLAYARFLSDKDCSVRAKAEEARKKRDSDYIRAVQTAEAAKIIDSYERAISLLEARGIEDYKDSKSKAEHCRTRIAEIRQEVAKREAKLEEERILKKKKKQKLGIIAGIVVALLSAVVMVYTMVIVPKQELAELKDRLNAENLKVGDITSFGTYNNEPVSWKVLDRKGDRVLLISEYGLDQKTYNSENESVTWEHCTLRTWLNDDFYNSAFSGGEKRMIELTSVSADKHPEYNTSPGNATEDKLFLLSIKDANKYFKTNKARMCKPTDYAVSNGAYVNDNNGNCMWWLRSPGYSQGFVAIVDDDGDVYEYGSLVYRNDLAVRPALWINLNS